MLVELGDAISTASTLPSEDATSTDFTVKVIFGVDGVNRQTRRFLLHHLINDKSGKVSLETLGSLFMEATGKILPRPLYYTDCDGDVAAVSTPRELHDAIAQCLDKKRLLLFEKEPKVQENQTYEPTAAAKLSELMNAAPGVQWRSLRPS
ncbi:expressed unknown protein [Seminavis robusta]|uniref:Uncharacterized protein n=1 Tax=Seminavis robusta TaxID=568900 RepID=A0A9N8E9Z8_9STRA|nr:expressed unknown protein [Seminavis robusta]|eukprot:Sro792_g203140.1 n/a (150) ;mRNA; r:30870-31405